MNVLIFFLLLSAFPRVSTFSTASTASDGPQDLRTIIHWEGFDRLYLVHLPPKTQPGKKIPVLMMLHGRGASAESARNDFGWAEKADKEGFIVVFPQALPFDPMRAPGTGLPDDFIRYWRFTTNDAIWWTSGLNLHYPYIANPRYKRVVHPLDTPFLVAVLHQVIQRYGADPCRVFVVGFSNGGSMVSDLARAVPNEITGAAIVGWVGPGRPKALAYPVSVFISIGTDDHFGRPSQADWDSMPAIVKKEWYGQETLPTLDEDVDAWGRVDQCKRRETTSVPWGQQTDWSDCLKGARVRGLSIDHLGHEWPGKPSRWNQAHPTPISLSLTDAVWTFLRTTP
jgi:polyhydroxybutyrate depolymerase